MKIEEAKFIIESNGECLEYFNSDLFLLCKNCSCNIVCDLWDASNSSIRPNRVNNREKRLQLAKHILRKQKLKRILEEKYGIVEDEDLEENEN